MTAGYWMAGVGAMLSVASAGTATAQATDAADIVVSASKRGLAARDLDGQAVVIAPDDLARTNVLNLDQLGQVVGDLTIRQRGNRAYDSITIRGQSSVDFYNPTVQFYVDGVPQDQASFGQALPLGIEQVEILYGPQGTLYGRGAIGGVVSLVTTPPTRTGLSGQALWGERTRDLSALGSVSLVPDSLAADMSFGYQDRDGQYRALAGKRRLGDSGTRSGRARLRYAPAGSGFAALLTYSRQVTHSSEEQYVSPADFATRTAFPVENRYRLAYDVASAKIDYDLGGVTLSSVSAWQTRDYDRLVFGIASPETQKTFTQEIRVASPQASSLNYVAGIYYEHTDFTFGRPDYRQSAAQTLQSFAVFGEATYAITDRLDLTGGGRLDYHKVKARAGASGIDRTNSADFIAFSPKLSLGYRPDDRTRLYALVSTGFKAGGFTRFLTPATISFSYAPEKVLNAEIGARTRLWADRLGLSVAAYRTRNSDYQYYVGFQPNQYLQNVGDVVSRGVEARADVRPGDGWAIDATLAYNDARFTRYHDPLNPAADLKGMRLPYAPRWTGRASIARRIGLPKGWGSLRPQAGATWASRIFFDVPNSFGQRGYTLYDAALSWEPAQSWAIDLVVSNLGDKTYAPYGVALGPGQTFYQLAAGREASVRLRTRF